MEWLENLFNVPPYGYPNFGGDYSNRPYYGEPAHDFKSGDYSRKPSYNDGRSSSFSSNHGYNNSSFNDGKSSSSNNNGYSNRGHNDVRPSYNNNNNGSSYPSYNNNNGYSNPSYNNNNNSNSPYSNHGYSNPSYSNSAGNITNNNGNNPYSNKGYSNPSYNNNSSNTNNNNGNKVGKTSFNNNSYADGRSPYSNGKNKGPISQKNSYDLDLDHALALSLQQEEQKKTKGFDTDEDLARALQESMYIHSPTTRSTMTPFWSRPTGQRLCKGCKKDIGSGRYLNCMGANWHPTCFSCRGCGQPITELEFSVAGNSPYHKHCYKHLFQPKCDVCKDYIIPNQVGLIEYRVHPFWGQKYCPNHERDNTPQCCSCERSETKDMKYISLDDGRKLCLECLQTSIMDTGECQPLYHSIRDFYEGMQMKIAQQVPMLLVERQALNEAISGEKNGSHRNVAETRGLCLSEEQTINTVTRRPTLVNGVRLTGVGTVPTRLIRKCEVSAILVLYGLPRLLTGSILTHELMHAWLRINGFRNLRLDVEEGICQVLAHMWLESEVMAGTSSGASSSSSSSSSKKSKAPRSAMEKKLGEFFLHQIEKDPSPVYGEGFRKGHASMMKFGLKRTLEHIKMTGSFPL